MKKFIVNATEELIEVTDDLIEFGVGNSFDLGTVENLSHESLLAMQKGIKLYEMSKKVVREQARAIDEMQMKIDNTEGKIDMLLKKIEMLNENIRRLNDKIKEG